MEIFLKRVSNNNENTNNTLLIFYYITSHHKQQLKATYLLFHSFLGQKSGPFIWGWNLCSGFQTIKIKVTYCYISFWRKDSEGRIYFQTHLRCWQNSVPCHCRIVVPSCWRRSLRGYDHHLTSEMDPGSPLPILSPWNVILLPSLLFKLPQGHSPEIAMCCWAFLSGVGDWTLLRPLYKV